jgi:hypothetical protein
MSITITAEDIAREHQEAMASLTPVQRRALERVRQARQRCHFNGRYAEENLQDLFQAEATKRQAAAEAAGPGAPEELQRLAEAVARGFPIAA